MLSHVVSWFLFHEWFQIIPPHITISLSSRPSFLFACWIFPPGGPISASDSVCKKIKCIICYARDLFIPNSLTLLITSPTSNSPRHWTNTSSHVKNASRCFTLWFRNLRRTCKVGNFMLLLLVFWIPGGGLVSELPVAAPQQTQWGALSKSLHLSFPGKKNRNKSICLFRRKNILRSERRGDKSKRQVIWELRHSKLEESSYGGLYFPCKWGYFHWEGTAMRWSWKRVVKRDSELLCRIEELGMTRRAGSVWTGNEGWMSKSEKLKFKIVATEQLLVERADHKRGGPWEYRSGWFISRNGIMGYWVGDPLAWWNLLRWWPE